MQNPREPQHPARPTGDTVRRILPALLLIGIAAIQLVLVEAWGLSRWRGGGMGMYSEFHPNRTELWAIVDGRSLPVEDIDEGQWQAGCPRLDRRYRCTRQPTASCLEQLAACLDPTSTVTRIEAWRPTFSPRDRAWSLERAAHLER